MAKEFSPAPEVERIAEKLIELFKPMILVWDIPIRYIFCSENPKKDGQEKAGLARKVTGLNAYLAGEPDGFFVLETGRPAWDLMTPPQKIAYVHHELCHFGIDDLGNLHLYPHDIEEFIEVAKVHGAHHEQIERFGEALEIGASDTSARAEMIRRILDK